MLSVRQRELANALEEVGQYGVCKIAGALTPDARHEVRMALERLDFQRAPEWVAAVRQDFDLLVVRLPLGSSDPNLVPLLGLSDGYAALLRGQAPDRPWLVDFAPSDIYVQRYGLGSTGISPHRDSRRFIKLISVFSLGSPAELRLFRDRRGRPLRRYQLDSGDLVLLRAPGFADRPSAGPLHSVSGPAGEARYSITLRMKQPAAPATAA